MKTKLRHAEANGSAANDDRRQSSTSIKYFAHHDCATDEHLRQSHLEEGNGYEACHAYGDAGREALSLKERQMQ